MIAMTGWEETAGGGEVHHSVRRGRCAAAAVEHRTAQRVGASDDASAAVERPSPLPVLVQVLVHGY
jgi:hypothetical protein